MEWKKIMSPISALLVKEVKFTVRQPIYWISSIVTCGFYIWIGSTSMPSVLDQVMVDSPEAASSISILFSQSMLILFPFSSFVFMSLYLFGQTFTIEKIYGQMEMLLTTPIKVNQVWMAKSLALLVLIMPFVTLITFAIDTLWETNDSISYIGPPIWVMLFAYIVGPLLAFIVVSFLGYLSMRVRQASMVQSMVFFTGFVTAFGGSYVVKELASHAEDVTNLLTPFQTSIVFLIALMGMALMIILARTLSKDSLVRSM